ncbi:hypothetical protein [Streptomyces sp. CC208A]|uniref:hypothetical protein n=1 Tax=Streptomyces sp. CC208A TaxID=3044573 RepID=UPI0024A9341D|nr:hypothetical protein [Streptomyces sp. CC208A]
MSIIHALLCWAPCLLLPDSGRRRACRPLPSGARVQARRSPAPGPVSYRPPRRSPLVHTLPLDGRATPLVRPYLVTHERLDVQQRRRLALVLAADFGIDLGQHVVGAPGWTA